jgi:hypothetical protein
MSALKLQGSRHDALAALLVCSSMILFSFLLHPNPRGFGTHRQLLLPPCFSRLVTRVPCPFCGMTTGFTWMARGDVAAAARCNLMAPPGFVAGWVLALLGLYGAVTGRGWLPAALAHPRFPRLLLIVIGAFWAANITLTLGWWHV